jgi:hypothetical protein
MMRKLGTLKTALLIPVVFAIAAAATPVSANWFGSDPVTGLRKNVGSAKTPTPEDIREYRKLKYEDANSPIMSMAGTTGGGIATGSDSYYAKAD